MIWVILMADVSATTVESPMGLLYTLIDLNNQEFITLDEHVLDTCAAIESYPLVYSAAGNNEWSKYMQSFPTRRYEAAFALVNLLQMCPRASTYPVFLKQSIIRQIASNDHEALRVLPKSRTKLLTDLVKVAPAKLVARGYIQPPDLASLFYKLLPGTNQYGCRPFKFNESKRTYNLAHSSGCTPEELTGLGRAFGLLVFYGVPIGGGLSLELAHILMDERRKWNMDDVRMIEPERFETARPSRSKTERKKADEIAYRIAREQYDLISDGFGEIIPRDFIVRTIASNDIHAMLVGVGPISPEALRRQIKRSPTAKHHSVRILLDYARDPMSARRLYHLLTGFYHVPVGGRKAMFPSIDVRITRYDPDQPRITANKTTRTLRIPEYSDEDRLRAELDHLLR
jgi:hypothetical protein